MKASDDWHLAIGPFSSKKKANGPHRRCKAIIPSPEETSARNVCRIEPNKRRHESKVNNFQSSSKLQTYNVGVGGAACGKLKYSALVQHETKLSINQLPLLPKLIRLPFSLNKSKFYTMSYKLPLAHQNFTRMETIMIGHRRPSDPNTVRPLRLCCRAPHPTPLARSRPSRAPLAHPSQGRCWWLPRALARPSQGRCWWLAGGARSRTIAGVGVGGARELPLVAGSNANGWNRHHVQNYVSSVLDVS